MCGLTGVIHYANNLIPEIETIHKMTDAITHRGPDDYGYFYDSSVLFGHRRLCVIDPIRGKQPMAFKKGIYEYTLIYNGELYNTDEVRKALLEKGYFFDTHCDTEVVLKAYVEWGEECVQHMNGIFAFAVWENISKSLFLARDRVGVKPLFYTEVDGYFIFGSEIKALLKHPKVKPIFNETSLLELFSLGPSRVLGSGLFKNIFEVKPAETIYRTKTKCYKKNYWKPITRLHEENKKTTIEHVNYLVEDAIKRQLVSDVPLCTFLSGGLDSSGISSIASKYLELHNKPPLTTYSIDYEDNDFYFTGDHYQPSNDNAWVDRVSNYIKSNHNRIEIGIQDLADSLWEATLANDYPGMADIDSSLLLFCKEVKKNHTVALSGECADEIFGGYPWYRNFTDIHYDGFPWNKHMDVRKSFLSNDLKRLKLEEFAHAEYTKSIQDIEYLDGEDAYDKGIRRLTYLNYKWFMVTLLTRKDRMSMYNGLEVRVPFADHRIIDYTYNVPWSLKYLDNIEKGLLRSALKDHLPMDVINRKKSPYPKTYNPKYNSLLSQLMKDILKKENSPIKRLISENQVNNLIAEDLNLFQTPWFGQLMKGPQFVAYLIQLNYFLEIYDVQFEGI
ncbi:MAG: asparagine synthase (glutamine-hydrolyzing) [Vallitaleaceae bacterium]|nr:asparagine synthase (glutamine-hydrolyzing) [Vallitaleaceae bacterium]